MGKILDEAILRNRDLDPSYFMRRRVPQFPSGGGGATDSDAQAFLTAASITDPTITTAIDNLVIALKAASIWTKCHAIYPFVGGSAATHKYNLKDPQDTNGAYRITWVNSLTHNSNGVAGNGSTGGASSYGNTNYNLSTSGAINDSHIAIYSRSTTSGTQYDLGASNGSTGHIYMAARQSDFGGNQAFANHGNNIFLLATSGGAGSLISSRRSATDAELYLNGSSVDTDTTNNTGIAPNLNMFVCAVNASGSPGIASPKTLAFASIGTGLTDTEAANYHTAIEAFQDTLGRGVV